VVMVVVMAAHRRPIAGPLTAARLIALRPKTIRHSDILMAISAEGGLIEVDNGNAVLVYTDTAYPEADEPAFVGAMSSAYHRTDAGWKLALYQQTQISD